MFQCPPLWWPGTGCCPGSEAPRPCCMTLFVATLTTTPVWEKRKKRKKKKKKERRKDVPTLSRRKQIGWSRGGELKAAPTRVCHTKPKEDCGSTNDSTNQARAHTHVNQHSLPFFFLLGNNSLVDKWWTFSLIFPQLVPRQEEGSQCFQEGWSPVSHTLPPSHPLTHSARTEER